MSTILRHVNLTSLFRDTCHRFGSFRTDDNKKQQWEESQITRKSGARGDASFQSKTATIHHNWNGFETKTDVTAYIFVTFEMAASLRWWQLSAKVVMKRVSEIQIGAVFLAWRPVTWSVCRIFPSPVLSSRFMTPSSAYSVHHTFLFHQ